MSLRQKKPKITFARKQKSGYEFKKRKKIQKGNGARKDKSSALWTVLCTPLYLYQAVALGSIGFLLEALFYGFTLNLDKVGNNDPTLNGMLLSIINILSTLIVMWKSKKIQRRRWLLIFQALILICGVMLVYLSFIEQTLTTTIISAIIIIVFVLGLANAGITPFFHYVSELFPVELRGTANSIVGLFYETLAISTPFMTMYSSQHHLIPMVGCCAVTLLSLPLT